MCQEEIIEADDVADVLLIGEQIAEHRLRPTVFTLGRWYPLLKKKISNPAQAHAGEVFTNKYKRWCRKHGYNFSEGKAHTIYDETSGHIGVMPKVETTKLLVEQAVSQLRANDIEDYLNSYLPSDAEYKVRLRPIVRNIELEKIRNAQEARSVTISLNIGRPLNDFLAGQVHEEKSVQSHLKALMEFSKMTLESNTFTLTLGLGRKKKASLDIGALIDLLDSINLDANCINEFAVNYRNGSDEKIDIAKLKDSTTVLKIYFPIQGTQLGTGYILNNMDEILRNERQKYYSQVEEYFSNVAEIGEDYEINKAWEERPVV